MSFKNVFLKIDSSHCCSNIHHRKLQQYITTQLEQLNNGRNYRLI